MPHPIVACARGWIGTRFHHQGRVKKTSAHAGGVDCLGLLIGVARELHLTLDDGTLLEQCDTRDYSHRPDTAHLRNCLARAMCEVPAHTVQPADILLLRVDGAAQHLAIISELPQGLGLIHAYAPARAVVEHALDAWWRQHIVAVFRLSN